MSDALTDIPREGVNPFENSGESGKDTPSESSPEQKPIETAPSQEGATSTPDEPNVPFHKHPRWQAQREENERLKQTVEQLTAAQQQVQQRIEQMAQPQQKVEVPSWFGGSPEAWEQYQAYEAQKQQTVLQQWGAQQQQAAQQQAAETQRWQSWVDAGLETVQEKYSVDFGKNKPLQNEFLKFVTTYLPTDDQGNVDLDKGWELFSQIKRDANAPKVAAKKALAGKTTSDDKAESAPKDYKTAKDLRHRDWKSLINL